MKLVTQKDGRQKDGSQKDGSQKDDSRDGQILFGAIDQPMEVAPCA